MSSIRTEIIMSPHVNGAHRLFGGQLMSWIDIIGAVEARRWAKTDVTTVAVDSLVFLNPAFENEIVVLEATLTWTGKTSMEVRVDSFVEEYGSGAYSKKHINSAYLVYVAMDEYGPKLVPEFKPKTQEEWHEFEGAIARKKNRLIRAALMKGEVYNDKSSS